MNGRVPRTGRLRDDRGSATIWLLAIGLVAILLAGAVAAAGSVMAQRHQAGTAADLGALAGARLGYAGEAVACARAAQIVAANHARMTSCVLDGLDLVVSVELDLSGPVHGLGVARAVSRAGPVRG